jgi:hypothetical protein
MEMHTVLLYPWNTNSETNRSMHKVLRLERCSRVSIDSQGKKKDNNIYCRLEEIEDLKQATLPTCKWFNL